MTDTLTAEAVHAAANPPTRATHNVAIAFGLVRVNLALFTAIEDGSAIARKMFTADGHPVGNQAYNKDDGKPVDPEAVVKRVEVGPNLWVDLTDDEIDAVLGNDLREKGYAEVESFIPLSAIGTTYRVVGEMQARPTTVKIGSKKAVSAADAKSFTLMRRAMADRQVAALFKLAGRTKTRWAVLTPDARVLQLAFADQVRAERPVEDRDVSDGELAMARDLIALLGVDEPVLVDDDGEKLAAYIAEKAAGGEVATIAEVEAVEAAEDTSLEAMLAAAVAAAREKPAAKKKAAKQKVAA